MMLKIEVVYEKIGGWVITVYFQKLGASNAFSWFLHWLKYILWIVK